MEPRKINMATYEMLKGLGLNRYYCDIDDNVIYVDDLQLLGQKLGCKRTSQTETGIYDGYLFRRLGGGK